MRKHLYLICFFAITWSVTQAQSGNNRDYRLKTLTVENAESKNDSVAVIKSTYTEYNRKGLPLLVITKGAQGVVNLIEINTYRNNKLLISHTESDSIGKMIRNVQYTYNAMGDKMAEKIYDGDHQLQTQTQFIYDLFGQKTEELQQDAQGKLLKRTVYTYDKKGSITQRTTYDAAGQILSQKIFTYQYR